MMLAPLEKVIIAGAKVVSKKVALNPATISKSSAIAGKVLLASGKTVVLTVKVVGGIIVGAVVSQSVFGGN